MPLLLGIPALFRFLLGLIPLFVGYLTSFFFRLATKTGIIALSLVFLLSTIIHLFLVWLSELSTGVLPDEYFTLVTSVLPDSTTQCITVIMSVKIAVFFFDLKDRFLSLANRLF